MTRLETLSQWIYDKKKSLFVVAFFSFQIASAGMLFLDFKVDLHSFFNSDSDSFQASDSTFKQFNQDQTLVFYLEFSEADRFSPGHLELIAKLDDLAHTLPFVSSVRSVSSFQIPFVESAAEADANATEVLAIEVTGEPQVRFKSLVTWAADVGDFSQVLAYVEGQEQLKGIMIADDYSGARVVAQLDRSESSYSGLMEIIVGFSRDKLMDAAESMVQEFENANPGVKVYIVGNAGFDSAALNEFIYFLILSLPLIVVLVGLTVVWVSGNVGLTAAGLIASASTVGATVGVFGWLPVTLDPSSFLAILLIMALSVTHCIYIGGRYIVAFNQSNSKQEALKESIRANLKPLFYNSAIASAGLIALLSTGSAPWILFSAMALVGIAISYAYSFIFMTFISDTLPELSKDKQLPTDALVALANQWVLLKPKQIIIAFVALFAIVGGGLTQISVDEDAASYFTPGNQFDDGLHVVASDLRWNKQLQLVIEGATSEVILSSQLILDLAEFRVWLAPQYGYVKVLGIDNVLSDLNRAVNAPALDSEFAIETEADLALLNRIDSSTLGGWGVSQYVNELQSEILITILVENIGDSELLSLKKNAADWWMNRNNGYEIEVSGADVILAEVSKLTVDGSVLGAAVATLLITLILMVALRSVVWGLISVLMVALPFSLVFSVYAAVYATLVPAMWVAFPIALGVIAINPLQFLTAFRSNQSAISIELALKRGFELSGLGISAVTIALGVFGVVLYVTSGLTFHAIIGAILASTVLLSGLCSLLLLPAIIVVFSEKNKNQSQIDEPDLRDAA